jgi:hypothetical protein
MIAGRSGTQKSGLALWWTCQMNLPTLYLSADMSPFTASARVASMMMGSTTDEIEWQMQRGGRARDAVLESMENLNLTFSFGPITWPGVDAEIEAYVELHNAYPEVIVLDNLMDIEGAASDYAIQMDCMQNITDLSRFSGSTVFVMHHASDKTWDARTDPWRPPSRDQIKNGLAEKPDLTLSVGLNPKSFEFYIAVLKQRMGPSDPTAQSYATIRADPERTRFAAYGQTLTTI